MKRGWLASLLAAAVVLPMAANGADVTKTPDSTPPVKAPSNASETATAKPLKGRLPPHYAKLPVDAAQKEKIYAIEASFAPKIKALQDQLDALKAEQGEQMKAVLTPEQQEKLKTLIAESAGKRHGKTSTDTDPKTTPTSKGAPRSDFRPHDTSYGAGVEIERPATAR